MDERKTALEELAKMLPELKKATGFTPNSYRALEGIFIVLDASAVNTHRTNANHGFVGYLASVKMAERLFIRYIGEC